MDACLSCRRAVPAEPRSGSAPSSEKLSPTTTTGRETEAKAILIQVPCGVKIDLVGAWPSSSRVSARSVGHPGGSQRPIAGLTNRSDVDRN